MTKLDIMGTQERIGRSEVALEIKDLGVPPMTNLQESAIDLRRRGFNVFPIPYASKQPFAGTSLKRLYSSSLHLCGDGIDKCRHGQLEATFASLFEGRKNIAVMCGKTSGNLVDIDCDTQSAYELMGKELDARGLPYWTFNSHNGRGGYLLRILEGEVANVVAGKSNFKDVELWGNSHYVVIPGSVHPTGEFYSWRGDSDPRYYFPNSYQSLPAVSVGELTSWLGLTLLKDDQFQRKPFEMFGLPAEYAVLSRRNREALAQGANDGERNFRLTALAYDLAGCGLERDDIEDDFLIAAARCTPVYLEGRALAILKCAYSKPRTRARKDCRSGDPTAKIQQLYAFAKSYDWNGKFKRKARMRKLFFMKCIDRSTMEGEVFRASVREMAEMANRKYQFASVCMRDLKNAKLIRLAVPGNRSNSGANVYAFGKEVVLSPIVDSNTTPCNTNVNDWRHQKITNTDAWKDVFGKLGNVAGEALLCLQAGSYPNINSIAKEIKAAWSSTDRGVKRLVKHRLAIHSLSEGLYYAEPVSESQLLMVALKLRTNGRAEAQRIKHQIGREIFLNRNIYKAMRP